LAKRELLKLDVPAPETSWFTIPCDQKAAPNLPAKTAIITAVLCIELPVISERSDIPTTEPNCKHAGDIPIPLAVLKYLSPERLIQLRVTAPGLCNSIDRIERDRKRTATVESLKKSVSEAVTARKLELTE
jgi:hypothetical protein